MRDMRYASGLDKIVCAFFLCHLQIRIHFRRKRLKRCREKSQALVSSYIVRFLILSIHVDACRVKYDQTRSNSSERRVSPTFSIPPPPLSEVMLGASLNLTCVAVGAPMPFVKWRKDPATDLTPDDNLPVGKNVLVLTDIQESANYTCTAASDLGIIDATTMVKVQCSYRASISLQI